MRMLEHIDVEQPVEIVPMTQDLDVPMIGKTDGVPAIILRGQEVKLFLNWAKETRWRAELERDLQSLSMDAQNRKMLSTWIPLVTFRTHFCGGRTPDAGRGDAGPDGAPAQRDSRLARGWLRSGRYLRPSGGVRGY